MDVRDLILSEAQMGGDEPAPRLPEGLSDQAVVWPEYEVVWRDGPDAVLCHRGELSDDLLVLLMSRGQFYLRRPDEPTARKMDAAALSDFLSGVGREGIAVVPWSSPLTADVASARAFCGLVRDPTFARLARRSMVWAEYGSQAESLSASAVASCLRRGQRALVNAAWGASAGALGEGSAAVALGMACGLTRPWTLDGDVAVLSGSASGGLAAFRDLFASLDRCVAIRERVGLDVLRDYMSSWSTLPDRPSWSFEAAALVDVLDLAKGEGVDFRPSALVGYATGGARRACADPVLRSRWVAEWRDVLVMQVSTDGRVIDKYPRDLRAAHDELTGRLYRNRRSLVRDDPARFSERVSQLAPNEWVSGEYFIEVPISAGDIVEEGRLQHSCVGGYVGAFLSGGTDLYFMRRCDDPDRPLVTVEVRDAEVRQAYGAYNRDLSDSERRWLEAWGERCGIAVAADFVPQYVGMASAESNQRHGSLVDGGSRRAGGRSA